MTTKADYTVNKRSSYAFADGALQSRMKIKSETLIKNLSAPS